MRIIYILNMTDTSIDINDSEIQDIITRNLAVNTRLNIITQDISNISNNSNNSVNRVDTPIPRISERMFISTLTIPSLNIVRGLTNTPSPLARSVTPILGSPCRIIQKHKNKNNNTNNKASYPECLCCMDNQFPISKKLLASCKAENKHNICYNCYKITSSKNCFYCFPLEKGNFKQRRSNNFERNYREGLTIVESNYPGTLENIIISNGINSPRENNMTNPHKLSAPGTPHGIEPKTIFASDTGTIGSYHYTTTAVA